MSEVNIENQPAGEKQASGSSLKWKRSKDGVLAGVSKGLAQTFDMEVGMVRFFWLISVLFWGIGVIPYICLAIALPREDKVNEAMKSKVLGVCSKLSRRSEIEVGLIRFLMLSSVCISFGFTLIIYFLAYFFMDDKAPESIQS